MSAVIQYIRTAGSRCINGGTSKVFLLFLIQVAIFFMPLFVQFLGLFIDVFAVAVDIFIHVPNAIPDVFGNIAFGMDDSRRGNQACG